MSRCVRIAEPIALNAKISDVCECGCCCECDDEFASIPDCVMTNFENICGCLDNGIDDFEDLGCISTSESSRVVLVSLGLFSIVKLIRNVQLLIPAFDFCVPNKECVAATDDYL